MKTKDRILQQSLHLFNEEGEGNVNTVDIANELDISPGNLYYHFKGKEPILERLLAAYCQEMTVILHAPEASLKNMEEHWLYLYVLAEEVYQYRFFYRNSVELLQRFPSLQFQFSKLQRQLENSITQLLASLVERGVFIIPPGEVSSFCQSLCLVLTQWYNYNDILGRDLSPKESVHSVVYQLISLCLPHLSGDQKYFLSELKSLYSEIATP